MMLMLKLDTDTETEEIKRLLKRFEDHSTLTVEVEEEDSRLRILMEFDLSDARKWKRAGSNV